MDRTDTDCGFMRRALELAERGRGFVNPNPMVGAVLVRDGRVLGEGYHERYGGPHAEVRAVEAARENLAGATAYVTLEPCSHVGKTPPCADLLIRHQVARVVIGSLDPNPLVAGNGVQRLRDAGISVTTGVLEQECRALNPVFFHYITHKTPYVVWKTAMTLDGKIASVSGESKWITGEAARQDAQQLRHWLSGIVVGVNTVIEDDPQLTCRLEHGANLTRIVVDSHLRIPLTARVLQNQRENQTIVATTEQAPSERCRELEQMGAKVLRCPAQDGRVDIPALLRRLGEERIDSLLLEGGATLSDSFFRAGAVHRAVVYVAPKILGGATAKTPVGGQGIARLQEAVPLEIVQTESVGMDWKITAQVLPRRELECLPELSKK